MSTPLTDDERYRVIWLVRRLFRALASKSDEMLQDSGISAADRAVMEFLYPDRALAVPEIARKYDVSRQHIQVTVNPLMERGLLQTSANPKNRRSPLIRLTVKGRNLFGKVLAADKRAIDDLFANIPKRDARTTCGTLQALLTRLKEGEDDAQT